ncbi:MAG: hypothetical protein UX57_C0009G0024 [Candidatus Uhrbacteria bacterium GW2011_GWE2_46_68]|uniref:Uncharacterized protein n=2 Tax=Candidatus Uhriibacteriota TaxID=1752732 RepID=A0A0G1Q7N1_9BACT|nr:MAG: hypothetical protein UX45_C0006G0024 [Candidatus Uhrbacteria bacterium GW2011_GWF2_46_218]KKU40857.1 MAG: hypothetical protein UX57_C0009G0024 [Candidatus Uhrbacteria bacterium GW2011_GWE2_46_68]
MQKLLSLSKVLRSAGNLEERKLLAMIATGAFVFLCMIGMAAMPVFPGSHIAVFLLGVFAVVMAIVFGLLLPENSPLNRWIRPPDA